MNSRDFSISTAKECAKSFSNATGIGCSVSLANGDIIYESGFCCSSCEMCSFTDSKPSTCLNRHIYCMTESERFGGKYIYLGPFNFTFFVSPIIEDDKIVARITVGPFLMIEKDDYIEIDLMSDLKLKGEVLEKAIKHLDNIPFVSPDKVNDLSALLFMAVGFMNNVNNNNKLIDKQKSEYLHNKISSHVHDFKFMNEVPSYPFDTESKMLASIANKDRPNAQMYLNELFGYIFFSTGRDLLMAKSRVYELLILISRTAIKNGADCDKCLMLSHDYLQTIPELKTMEELSLWLSTVMNEFMDNLFDFMNNKHSSVLSSALQYIQSNFHEKITLEHMSQLCFLSPSYFSRLFKQETGVSFTTFLTQIRIEKSKNLLSYTNDKLSNIALSVGFEDQSYFTKVFKKHVGVSPYKYRELNSSIISHFH